MQSEKIKKPSYTKGKRIGIGIAILIVILIALNLILKKPQQATTETNPVTHVSVAPISKLSSSGSDLSVVGTVTSVNQATVLAQSSGEIVTLSHKLGDRVGAGEVIAEFNNASAKAAVVEAQGALAQANAMLAKTNEATIPNTSNSSSQAAQSLQNSILSAQVAFGNAYSALDDAIHTKADVLFANPRTSNPEITLTVPDSTLVSKIEQERVIIEPLITEAQTLSKNQTQATIDSSATTLSASIQETISFISDLIKAVNETPPSQSSSASTLAGYQTLLSGARTELSTALSGVVSAKSGFDAALSSSQSATTNANSGSPNDVKASQAAVLQAQGALDAANAALANTIIRTPISGTIVSLPITQGSFVTAYTPVATISNPNALYIDIQVTQSDAATLSIGSKALINGNTVGIVTFIAPALDPTTGKVKVKVGIQGDTSVLSSGEVVSASIARTQEETNTTAITIPINAVKITPSGPVVFTVSTSSTLVAHPVVFGPIVGNSVTITSGVQPTTEIVTDARGLSEGQSVEVINASSTTP